MAHKHDEATDVVERALLGGLLRWPAAIDDVTDLRPEHFRQDAHAEIYRSMLRLRHDLNRPVDVATVADDLHARGRIADVRHSYLAELWDREPTGGEVAYHAELVRAHALWRALAALGGTISRWTDERAGLATDAVQEAEEAIFRLSQWEVSGEPVPLAVAVTEACDRLDARMTRADGLSGLSTSFGDLDKLTAGLQPSELVVIAARPSVGKTALGLALVVSAARSGTPVFLASLEQSRLEIAERLLSLESGVDGQSLRRGTLSPEDVSRLSRARQSLRGLPLHLDDAAGQTAARIASTARRLRAKHRIGLVVVDYLQLVESAGDGRRENRQEEVAATSRRLKALAKDLQVPVVALAQLNRQSEHRSDGRPRLSDLRDSGQIEADADVVILLHRPAESPGLLDLIVAKQRNGPVGEVTLVFRPETMCFEDYTPGRPGW